MTDYTKSTNFASKDALLSGNPLKIVKGTEIDTELNNIATAISTKADTSQVSSDISSAIAAATISILSAAYPVGSVYINASSTTNPASLLGFGTWVSVGDGKVLVNYDAGDTTFNTLGNTGGSKDAIVVSHTHTVTDPGHTHANGGYNQLLSVTGAGTIASSDSGSEPDLRSSATISTATTGISINSTGSSGTNGNLQPYVVVKMWKRTA